MRARHLIGNGVDGRMFTIKMTILSFEVRNDREAYLEWERKIKLISDFHNYSEEKKVKIAILEFTDYVIAWWGQVMTN